MSITSATTLNSADARVQAAVTTWMCNNAGVTTIDQVVEPGADQILATGQIDKVAELRQRVVTSKESQGSDIIAIVGHYHCAENDVKCQEKRRAQIHRAMSRVAQWKVPSHVIGLYLDEDWQIEVVDEMLV